MKKIVLPPTEGGYYRFGELPQLIAEALHPDEKYPDDVYLSAIVWRDDGTEHGQYFKCAPPPGLVADSMTSLDGWAVTPVTEEDEAEDLDAGEWRRLRKEAENSDRLSDGSLLILAEKTQRGVIQQLSIIVESKWYTDRMREAARRGQDDPRRLCVVDGNLNSLTYTHGAALDRGWVHIDKLNQWGATLDTVNLFSVMQSQPEGLAEQQATERGTLANLPAKRRSDRLDAAIQTAKARSAKSGDTTPSGVFNLLEKAATAGETPFVRVGQKEGAISLVWKDANGKERDCTFATLSSRLSRSKTKG